MVAFLAALTFSFVSCDEELDTPPIAEVTDQNLLTIADIYQMYADSGEYTFVDDYYLYATVTMDDYEGNIYKEAYVQDSTGGINLYKLTYAESLKVGEYIRLNLKGVKIIDYSGKMELTFVDILESEKNIVVQNTDVPLTPKNVTIEDIQSGAYDCQLIKIDGIQFKATDTSSTYATVGGTFATNRDAQDCNGQEIIIRTSDYADFAGLKVPSGNGSIIAIATKHKYNSGDFDWQLLIRSIDEVNMDNPRCGE